MHIFIYGYGNGGSYSGVNIVYNNLIFDDMRCKQNKTKTSATHRIYCEYEAHYRWAPGSMMSRNTCGPELWVQTWKRYSNLWLSAIRIACQLSLLRSSQLLWLLCDFSILFEESERREKRTHWSVTPITITHSHSWCRYCLILLHLPSPLATHLCHPISRSTMTIRVNDEFSTETVNE